VKDDRIVAQERPYGTPEVPRSYRVEYEPADMRIGYGLLVERCAYNEGDLPVGWTCKLALAEGGDASAPKTYEWSRQTGRARESLTITFGAVKFNAENAIVLDPAARDALKAGWEKRSVYPEDIRLHGDFQRKVDNDLSKARWTSDVRGEIHVWGMERVEVSTDDKSSRAARWQEVGKTAEDHINEALRRMRGRPFDVEFKGCGFRSEESKELKGTIVRVIGYEAAEAFLLDEDGAIAGVLDRLAAKSAWWLYKLKERNGFYTIERMERDVDGRKFQLDFRYAKRKDIHVLMRFDAVGTNRWGADEPVGIATYEFRKLKVSVGSD
jgi:hypothetical protein